MLDDITENQFQDAAIDLAKRSYYVFRLKPLSKDPAFLGWKDEATNDPAIVAELWKETPDCNIGIAHWKRGDAAIDLDVKAGKNGIETLIGLELAHGDLPAAPTVITASGGRHHIFRVAPGLRCSAGRVGIGIDVRAAGGYTVAPGSIVNGKAYRWADDCPREAPDMPPWLDSLARTPQRDALKAPEGGIAPDLPHNVDRARRYLASLVAAGDVAVSGEGGNNRTYRLGAALHDLGVSSEKAIELAEAWNEACDPPWSNDELATIIQNSFTYAENEFGCEALPENPMEKAFGKWLRKLIDRVNSQPNSIIDLPHGVKAMFAADETPLAIDWLWKGWFARGKLHLIAGAKGAGKSTICFDLMATITTGGRWPDGSQAEKGSVVIWSAEDDFNDTILPRFLAAGGDKSKLIRLESFDPALNTDALYPLAERVPDLKLMVVDPIVMAVAGDSHKNAETRRGLQPLVDFAEKFHVALIGITHFSKGTEGRNPVERVTGSLAFSALARIVLCAAADEDGKQRRLIRAASNIGKSGDGFAYTLEEAPVIEHMMMAQRVRWGEALHGQAFELVNGGARGQSEEARAAAFILEMLANGAVSAKDMKDAAEANSHSWITVKRAKAKMPRVKVVKHGGGGWWWGLAAGGADR